MSATRVQVVLGVLAVLLAAGCAACGGTPRERPEPPAVSTDISQLAATPLDRYVAVRDELLGRLRQQPDARQALPAGLEPGTHRALAEALAAMLPPDGEVEVHAAEAEFARWLRGRLVPMPPVDAGGRSFGFQFRYVRYEERDAVPVPAAVSDGALLELAAKSPGSLTDKDVGPHLRAGIDDVNLVAWVRLEAILGLVERADPNGPSILGELLESELIAESPGATSELLLCVEATGSTELLDHLVEAIAARYRRGTEHEGALDRLFLRHPDAVRRYLSGPERADAAFRETARWALDHR